MRTITVRDQQVNIYNRLDFPYETLNCYRERFVAKGNKSKYCEIFGTFDIETTTITTRDNHGEITECFGFMYVWQFAINKTVCMGRTWPEFVEFLDSLKEVLDLSEKKRLVIYAHNLAFEFQFLRNFIWPDYVFARKEHQVVYSVHDFIEFRCSYILSNMSLAKFIETTPNAIFLKMKGEEFDYSIRRYPDTKLTDKELGYCVCDVLGLEEAINHLLETDTLATIPITSTGYVRRDYREKCKQHPEHRKQFLNTRLYKETYLRCREASRGAISGSNHMHTDEILEDVDSFDIVSSYPYQMATKYFPQSKFVRFSARYGTEKFEKLINEFCCIICWTAEKLRVKRWVPIPYISKAKCRAIEKFRCGNGKVYTAERIGMCCTEIDFKIIREQYDMSNIKIFEIWIARKGPLSSIIREHLMYMFQEKTNLKGGDDYLYNKFKNKINGTFGMMLTDILRAEIVFDQNSKKPWGKEEIEDYITALNKYYHNTNSFLSYQHGVWILAHARASLVEGMSLVKQDLVQVDTDSVKTLRNHRKEFELINTRIIKEAEEFDIKPYAIRKDGKKEYLGIWEHEILKDSKKQPIINDGGFTYAKFKTLGAKKYAYEDYEGTHITVAGLGKQIAAKYLTENGGLNSFRNGYIIPRGKSGRTVAYYNDMFDVELIEIDGHEILLGSNVGVEETSYTLGMASDWFDMILKGDNYDNFDPSEGGAFKGWL